MQNWTMKKKTIIFSCIIHEWKLLFPQQFLGLMCMAVCLAFRLPFLFTNFCTKYWLFTKFYNLIPKLVHCLLIVLQYIDMKREQGELASFFNRYCGTILIELSWFNPVITRTLNSSNNNSSDQKNYYNVVATDLD